MEKNTHILVDTNICIDRTLAFIEPPISDDYLEKLKDKINELTNNNLCCKILISEVIISELKNNLILFREIRDFCIKRLHYGKRSHKILLIQSKAEKSIVKFIEKYSFDEALALLTKSYPGHIQSVKRFYLKYPERLKEITDSKCKGKSTEFKKRKIFQRKQNLPEQGDILLLSHAIELDKKIENRVAVFSRDKDFTTFNGEIASILNIDVISIK